MKDNNKYPVGFNYVAIVKENDINVSLILPHVLKENGFDKRTDRKTTRRSYKGFALRHLILKTYILY